MFEWQRERKDGREKCGERGERERERGEREREDEEEEEADRQIRV